MSGPVAARSRSAPKRAQPSSVRSQVLVVDDDQPFRDFLAIGLLPYGFEASGAVDGVDGLAHLASSRPVAIVTDMTMPRLDGLEFCRRVRATHAYDDIPIIVLTSGDVMGERMVAATHLRTVTASTKAIPMKDLALLLRGEPSRPAK